jgi:hypothetical protein
LGTADEALAEALDRLADDDVETIIDDYTADREEEEDEET